MHQLTLGSASGCPGGALGSVAPPEGVLATLVSGVVLSPEGIMLAFLATDRESEGGEMEFPHRQRSELEAGIATLGRRVTADVERQSSH
jgi:hypothetical protein